MKKEDWLKYRTEGIGGSDVSVIAGINPFRSAHRLWLEKTGRIEAEQTDSEYAVASSFVAPAFMACLYLCIPALSDCANIYPDRKPLL